MRHVYLLTTVQAGLDRLNDVHTEGSEECAPFPPRVSVSGSDCLFSRLP